MSALHDPVPRGAGSCGAGSRDAGSRGAGSRGAGSCGAGSRDAVPRDAGSRGASGRGAGSGGAAGPSENLWRAAVRNDPEHAKRYARRWRDLAAQGRDIFGEARLIDALAERGSRILDAGCGTGRIGGWLSERGHDVVGVDLDAHLISVAREDYPGAEWQVADLARLALDDETGDLREFDLIVSAGNVMTFLAGSERLPTLRRMRGHLAPHGRLVVGFGAGRGYEFVDFAADAYRAGLELEQHYSSWQLHPPAADFMVAVLSVIPVPPEPDE